MTNVSHAVAKTIDRMTLIHNPIRRDLINYSALAREIKPTIEKETGKKISNDSLIMAVRRYCISRQKNITDFELMKTLAEAMIIVRTGMILYNTKNNEEIYNKVLKEIKINWAAGERRYIIQRTDQVTLITNAKFDAQIKKIIETESSKIISHDKDLSIITIHFSKGGIDNPDVISTTSALLAENKINIKSIFSTYSGLSYLISDNQAGKAYATIHELITQAKITTGQKVEDNEEN